MKPKYELVKTDATVTSRCGEKVPLYRIRAVRKVFYRIEPGELGGYVTGEHNLSQYGECWIDKDAMVLDDALVTGNGKVFMHAVVYGNAVVMGDSLVASHALVGGHAVVKEDACVNGRALVTDEAVVGGSAQVDCDAVICGHAVVGGHAIVDEGATVCGDAVVGGTVALCGHIRVCDMEVVATHGVELFDDGARPLVRTLDTGRGKNAEGGDK